jgi:hypothetical protein
VEKDLTIDLVIIILNDESIIAVNKPIGTDVPIDLFEGAESLCNIHASLSDYIRMLVESLPYKLYFLTSLVMEHHLERPILPIT